jgi:hypothetical protein
MSDSDKDIEILALRHQIGVLQRQLGGHAGTAQSSRRRTQLGLPPDHGELLVLGVKVASSMSFVAHRE